MSGSLKFNEGDRQRQTEGGSGGGQGKRGVLSATLFNYFSQYFNWNFSCYFIYFMLDFLSNILKVQMKKNSFTYAI